MLYTLNQTGRDDVLLDLISGTFWITQDKVLEGLGMYNKSGQRGEDREE